MQISHSSLRRSMAAIAAGAMLLSSTAFAESGDTLMSSSSSSPSSASSASSSSLSSEATNYTLPSGSGANIGVGKGTIIIEQKNGGDVQVIGKWTLILPTNAQKLGSGSIVTTSDSQAGNYTLLVQPPKATAASIRIYRNNIAEKIIERPQANFRLEDGDVVKIVVHFVVTRVGLVSVDSDPQGVNFTMRGPNDTTFTGTTPMSYPDIAVGQYEVRYESLKGCTVPPPKSLLLQEASRISFTLELSCEAADKIRERLNNQENNDTTYISITSDGQQVRVRDVPQASWFAQYVINVAKYGILGGYKDAAGNLTGEYGPGNNVTIAELSKIAHKLAGVSEEAFAKTAPDNPSARGTWFSAFFASAESRGWTIYNSGTVDPARSATRGEVLVTLYQALDIPLTWQKGNVFTDVTARTAYAAAIENAALKKIVEGHKDANGVALNTFGPAEAINRAEMAKIISKMIDAYRSGSSSSAKK